MRRLLVCAVVVGTTGLVGAGDGFATERAAPAAKEAKAVSQKVAHRVLRGVPLPRPRPAELVALMQQEAAAESAEAALPAPIAPPPVIGAVQIASVPAAVAETPAEAAAEAAAPIEIAPDVAPTPADEGEVAVPRPNPMRKAMPAVCGTGRLVRTTFYWQGSHTANGERFDPDGLTAAHRTLPFGTKLRVTNPRTGKTIEVRVNDRGPFKPGLHLDLSRGAARAIGLTTTGSVCIL
ncbi:septal ring lytic transglycosylase RlpA family protein [Rhodovulum sp. PH10]|uniref:septal ring lytic transglycosylase RlpA family protein n=1 Tax=Rhodovulum sp. PH10 TaxID=1187851 RepID=UPI0006894366|nr:septal ring lytic transglycosylase RlpA family protein [Rhodovulum sp. PH10]